MIYNSDLKIISFGTERIVVIKLYDFKRLLMQISKERLTKEFTQDKEAFASWNKTLKKKWQVIERIEKKYSVKG